MSAFMPRGNGTAVPITYAVHRPRFSDLPKSIDIPVSAGDDEEDDETAVVEIDPDALADDPTELCTLLENESSPRKFWMQIALAYAKQGKLDIAVEIVSKGLAVHLENKQERLPMLTLQTWLNMQKSREAPRKQQAETNGYDADVKAKSYWLAQATQALNESTKLDPSSRLNSLARGTHTVFRSYSTEAAERSRYLEQALKIFDEIVHGSKSTNMLAIMGKARVYYGKKRYEGALELYQEVLRKRPDMDPDPRIGIGLCLWQLNYKDSAKTAWERALELDPDSKVVHILLAQCYLETISKLPEMDRDFIVNYKLFLQHAQNAYRLDKNFPMACTALASHLFTTKGYAHCEHLARKAMEYSDSSGVSSDAFYLIARKLHVEKKYEDALQYYRQSVRSREGGYLAARVGLGQVQVLTKDIPGAKLTFEAIVNEYPKCVEAKTILGTLYADEVLSSIPRSGMSATKEDVPKLHSKAISFLEAVRATWKPEKQTDPGNEPLLLTLARLYENEHPEKALQCLQVVEKIYNSLQESDEEVVIPLQLLNNMATLNWHCKKYPEAKALYQQALSKIPDLKNEAVDTDALATTLTYNLGRCEEAAGDFEAAQKNYEQLLQHHADYVDANMRLIAIAIKKGDSEGVKRVNKLMESDGENLEVRALYAQYLQKQKRNKPANLAEDPEQRHYKHSLQHYDKHDRYSLTGMGNLYLVSAREMKRGSEADKEKRRKTYEKAVEFFDKALQLDPKNAYAAQGVGIAMVEDKKDLKGAIGIFTKVKDTLSGERNAVINLAHCLAGLEQWSRAIENYEAALAATNGRDPLILSCLGRTYFAKGKKEVKLNPAAAFEALKMALEYAKKARDAQKDSPVYQFNVAFVQSELCQMLVQLPETQRSVVELESAGKGLEQAVQTFQAVAKSSHPPYPPKDIEARARMTGTLQKKLLRTLDEQKEYDQTQAAKLEAALQKRLEKERLRAEAEAAKREEERKEAERKRELYRIQERETAEFLRKKAEREEREEMERGYEEGRKRQRKENREIRNSRKGRKEDAEGFLTDGSGEEEARPQKKRKLVKKGGQEKYKSKEVIEDSDEDIDMEMGDAKDESSPAGAQPPILGSQEQRDLEDLFGDED